MIVLNDVEQLALAQLGDQDKLRAGLKGVQEQYNVLMLKFLEDFYLIPHDFDILLLLPFLFNRFYGHKLTCELAPGLVDVPICALPDQ